MKVDLLDSKLKKVDSVELNESIWKVAMNPDLVAQCVNIYMSNARTGNAHVKTRGDVSGGGRKPWKQKGTGRARSGSSRSPVWVGGGATFVPNERNWTKRLNKKMKKSALSMMLSERVGSEILNVVKDLYEVERDAVSDIKSVLLVSDNPEVVLKFRNVPSVTIADSMTLNALDLVKSRKIYFDAEAVTKLEARLLNE